MIAFFFQAQAACTKVYHALSSSSQNNLNLVINSMGADGAKAIAEALKVNPVLTKLYLQGMLGEAGKKALGDAVKDRSGFELGV